MHIRFFLACWIFFIPPSIQAQAPSYPRGYFRNPLNLPMNLVANFGELRTNHWHMGLDIRTNHQVNQPVYAAADGYVARIRVEPLGFGQAIFINHPNGLTTVYGHLNQFFPALAQYVREQQYARSSWPLELEFQPDQFPVRKGQFIAYSGNAGASQGPHLHFEIRDTRTTRCLNPLLFGLPVPDPVAPTITRLALYDRSRSVYGQSPRLVPLEHSSGNYHIKGGSPVRTGWRKLSFAIGAFDRLGGSANPVGIYQARVWVDSRLVSGFTLDSIDYTETRDVNAQIDYPYHARTGIYLQHLSPLPGDNCRVYDRVAGEGVLVLEDQAIHQVRIEVLDAYLNHATLQFSLRYDPSQAAPEPGSGEGGQVTLTPNYVNVWERPDFEAYLPEGAIYDTVRTVYQRFDAQEPAAASARHVFGDPAIPVHGEFTVRLQARPGLPDAWRDRLVIRCQAGGRTVMRKASWENGWIMARFNGFGEFQAFGDLEPPLLPAPGQGDTLDFSGRSALVLTPSDRFGVASLQAELDGRWLLFTNDKGRSWVYRFDERCPYGIHQLRVRVRDLAGNETVRTWWFRRYAHAASRPHAPQKPRGSHHKPVHRKHR